MFFCGASAKMDVYFLILQNGYIFKCSGCLLSVILGG